MDPALQEILLAEMDPDEIVEALVRLSNENDIPDKLTPIAQFGDILSCRIRRSDILDVYNSELTKSMKAARFVAYNRNFESHSFNNNLPLEKSNSFESRGNNTIVAVLDWGIDFAHPNFRNPDGSTRFIAIWDQSFRDETGLAPYGYGRLFTREQINQALQSRTPYKRLNYHPGKSDSLGIGTHGTHVMDIAAGNGKIGNKGVASEADLIFVHLASRGTSGTGNLGDSVRILEGIDAVRTLAGDQSLVINMSIGRHGGPHDGLTLVEQGIDNFLESHNNTMICQSTGNYYKENAHHSGIVRPGKIKTFSFIIQRADKTLNEMEIWYHGNDQLGIELINNQSGQSFKCPINSRQNIVLEGKKIGRIYHRDSEPNNGKNHINLFLYKNAPSGRWTVKLKGEKVYDGRYHAWIERDGSCKNCQSRFDPSYADVASTTGTIANGFNSIVCGAFDATSRSFAMAPFSSKGPTLDGRSKPDIVASGRYISAARSTPASSQIPRPSTTQMSGTSMASPRVAGATALVLEQLPPNTPFWQIRNIIIGTANPVKSHEPSRVGAGKLNIAAAIKTAKHFADRVKNKKRTLTPIGTSNTYRLPPMPDTSIIDNYASESNNNSGEENFLDMDENQIETNVLYRDSFVPTENVDDIIKNAKSLRGNAGSNQISKLHSKVSKLTGLVHPALGNNPLFGVTDDMILSANHAHKFHGSIKSSSTLLALWVKEGGAQHHTNMKNQGLFGYIASSDKNAKSLFRSQLYFVEMGIDKFIAFTSKEGSDNIPFPFIDANASSHETAFETEIKRLQKAKYLPRNFASSINDSLQVRAISKINSTLSKYEVKPNNHFYIYSLLLADALFREFEDRTKKIMKSSITPDFGLTYMCWNMGEGKFKQFVASANRHRFEKEYLSTGISPSIAKWAFEFPPKYNEWLIPRNNASKIRYFKDVYDLVFNNTKSSTEYYHQDCLTDSSINNLFQEQTNFTPSYRIKSFKIISANAILRDANLVPLNVNRVTSEIGKNAKGYGILIKGKNYRILNIKILSGGNILAQVASSLRSSIPLGWTIASNFVGGLFNESLKLKIAPGKISSQSNAYTVADPNALIRQPIQGFPSTGAKLPIGTFVNLISLDQSQKYAQVTLKNTSTNTTQNQVFWTSKSNLIKDWLPILNAHSAWKRGKFIGMLNLVDIIGTNRSIKQVTGASLSAYQQLTKSALSNGVLITLNSGFRSYPQQDYLYQGYINKKPGFNLAARPGRSNHQNGIAFDLNTTGKKGTGSGPVYTWLKNNAPSYGFIRTVSTEHWHWEYNPRVAAKLKTQGKYRSWNLAKTSDEHINNIIMNDHLTDSKSYIRISSSDNYDQSYQDSDNSHSSVHLRSSDTLIPGQINWRKILNQVPIKKPNTTQLRVRNLDNPYTCGFYGKKRVVSKKELIDEIITIAKAEHRRWLNGSNKFEEDDTDVFDHLINYWLSVNISDSRHASPSKLTQIQGLIPSQNLNIRSVSATNANTINNFINGRLSTKISSSITHAKESANDDRAWSAAFVVYCIRKATIDLELEWEENGQVKDEGKILAIGGSHSKYGRPAYLRRRRNVTGCYQAFGRTEHPIELGDIILTDRRTLGVRSDDEPCNRTPFGFRQVRSSYRDLSRQPACTHGDIVIKIDHASNSVITLGGNVNHSVRKRRYPINAQGFLDINNTTQRIYSQESDNGTLSATTTLPVNASLHSKSTSRIFAVLKLVEQCKIIPGTPYHGGVIT